VVELSDKIFEDADLEEFLALSRSEYSNSVATHATHNLWKHGRSPFGASRYLRLIASGKTVGRAMLWPRLLHAGTQKIAVACVTDVLIERGFRSPPSNFIALTGACAEIPQFDAVYHTSNRRSDALYRKLLRLPMPFSLRGYGLPLRIAGFLRGVFGRRIELLDYLTAPFRWLLGAISTAMMSMAKVTVSSDPVDDDALTALCKRCALESGPLLERSNAYLKWRFEDAPLWAAKVHRVEHKRRFVGYIAARKFELHGVHFLVLMDFVLDPDLNSIAQIAVRMWLVKDAIDCGADAVFTMINPYNGVARKCAGLPLIRVPERLLPQKAPVFFRSRSERSRSLERERAVHLTLADLDYF
jgi:hypothetical protein